MVSKHLFNVLFLLLCTHICAQEKAAIKIFVTDAETGKPVKNAKVTLEGFEISPLEGRYNEEENYYYFNTVPEGYNTVMAYHKKYNEKGFQDIGGLPQEISLALHDRLNMIYSFLNYPEVYVEDPYKMVIVSDSITDYNTFTAYIEKNIAEKAGSLELINPCAESVKIWYPKQFLMDYAKPYPVLDPPNYESLPFYDIPMVSGHNIIDTDIRALYFTADKVAYFVRKKDGTKFKRYNDPNILSLNKINGINFFAVVTIKLPHGEVAVPYDKEKTKVIDRANRKYKHNDPSMFFFYYNFNYVLMDDGSYAKNHYIGPPDPYFIPEPHFVLVERTNYEIKDGDLEIIPLQDKSIGLGILDYYEYIYAKSNKKSGLR